MALTPREQALALRALAKAKACGNAEARFVFRGGEVKRASVEEEVDMAELKAMYVPGGM